MIGVYELHVAECHTQSCTPSFELLQPLVYAYLNDFSFKEIV